MTEWLSDWASHWIALMVQFMRWLFNFEWLIDWLVSDLSNSIRMASHHPIDWNRFDPTSSDTIASDWMVVGSIAFCLMRSNSFRLDQMKTGINSNLTRLTCWHHWPIWGDSDLFDWKNSIWFNCVRLYSIGSDPIWLAASASESILLDFSHRSGALRLHGILVGFDSIAFDSSGCDSIALVRFVWSAWIHLNSIRMIQSIDWVDSIDLSGWIRLMGFHSFDCDRFHLTAPDWFIWLEPTHFDLIEYGCIRLNSLDAIRCIRSHRVRFDSK